MNRIALIPFTMLRIGEVRRFILWGLTPIDQGLGSLRVNVLEKTWKTLREHLGNPI